MKRSPLACVLVVAGCAVEMPPAGLCSQTTRVTPGAIELRVGAAETFRAQLPLDCVEITSRDIFCRTSGVTPEFQINVQMNAPFSSFQSGSTVSGSNATFFDASVSPANRQVPIVATLRSNPTLAMKVNAGTRRTVQIKTVGCIKSEWDMSEWVSFDLNDVVLTLPSGF